MSNLFLIAVPTLGIEFMDNAWLIGSVVIIAVCEIVLGVMASMRNDVDFNMAIGLTMVIVFVGLFWPIFVVLGIIVLLIITPFLIGKYSSKFIKYLDNRKVNDVNKIMYKK